MNARGMKRVMAMFVVLGFALCMAGCAQQQVPDFMEQTGLDRMQQKLDDGVQIASVSYTDGYGFSISEFETTDPAEMQALWDAIRSIKIESKSNESVTDWYPRIVFTLSDGSSYDASFERHWLVADNGRTNYNLTDDDEFWSLTASLVAKHAQDDADPAAVYGTVD